MVLRMSPCGDSGRMAALDVVVMMVSCCGWSWVLRQVGSTNQWVRQALVLLLLARNASRKPPGDDGGSLATGSVTGSAQGVVA